MDFTNKTATDYKVLWTIKNVTDLEKQVREELKNGYIPTGGICFSPMGMIWQAMVKIE